MNTGRLVKSLVMTEDEDAPRNGNGEKPQRISKAKVGGIGSFGAVAAVLLMFDQRPLITADLAPVKSVQARTVERLDAIETRSRCDRCVAFCVYKGGSEQECFDLCERQGEC